MTADSSTLCAEATSDDLVEVFKLLVEALLGPGSSVSIYHQWESLTREWYCFFLVNCDIH